MMTTCYCLLFIEGSKWMEIKETCKILLDKGNTQKVKCYKFFNEDINRELAVHADIDRKFTITNITDTATGLRLCSIQKEIGKVTEKDINETLYNFIKHYTIDTIKEEFEKLNKEKVGIENK